MATGIIVGDCREVLGVLPEKSVNCIVTSPPYFGLRDYGVAGQIGLEQTPQAYVEELVAVFRDARRVLRDDGTLWLNLGDSYGKAKQLLGIPWRVAFALQADGWHLRQDIIWHKPNPMPESVRDRCTKAHEYLFLLSKSERYWFDAEAISEDAITGKDLGLLRGRQFADPANVAWHAASIRKRQQAGVDSRSAGTGKRNRRSVWTVTPKPFKGAHFATFPPALIEPCILAGCPEGGTVLDPFGGAGTTGLVADRLGRNAVLIELNPEYASMAESRLAQAA